MIAEPIHQTAAQAFERLYVLKPRRESLWSRLMRLIRPLRRAA